MTAPRLPVLDTNYVAETAAIGTVIGRVTVSDPDGDLLTVSLVDAFGDTDLASAFALLFDPVALNYTVVVRDASKINYETVGGTIHLRIKVADATQAVIKDFPITIVDVNEAPTDIVLSNRSVEEHAAAGTWIATLSGTDQDAGDVLSYALKDAATSPFAIVQNASGAYELRVKDGSLIDYAADPDKKIDVTVVASDKYGLTTEKTFALDILDVNHAPTDITISYNSVRELSHNGTVVTQLFATDADPDETFTYTLLDDAGGRFYVDGDRLKVKDGLLIDFEQNRQHQITVLVVDRAGASLQKTLTIAVRDWLNEYAIGSAGADLLKGGLGDDYFDGADGNDTLIGGYGMDQLIGGSGQDIFQFELTPVATALSTIFDFTSGADKIHLKGSKFDLGAHVGKTLTEETLCLGATPTKSSQKITYNKETGDLFYDPDGSELRYEAIKFATFINKPDLSYNDFLVIA
jgi:hypothetical protein